MNAPVQDPREESIGDLFGRLIEDGRSYARAEIEVLKEIARHRAGRARTGMLLLAGGAVLLLSSLTALVLGLVLGLAALTGPLLAGIIIAAALAGIGYLLVRVGLKGLKALSGDDEERQAVVRGETSP